MVMNIFHLFKLFSACSKLQIFKHSNIMLQKNKHVVCVPCIYVVPDLSPSIPSPKAPKDHNPENTSLTPGPGQVITYACIRASTVRETTFLPTW